MKYADLLSSYIENSGLTLDQIVDKCKKDGTTIHPTYISKLRKGLRQAPTEEISRALAKACGGNPEKLIFAGYLEKTPSPIVEKFLEYEGTFSAVKKALLQLCNDSSFMDNLSAKIGYKITFEQLCSLFQKLSVSDQLKFITSSDFTIHVDEIGENELNVWIEYLEQDGKNNDDASRSKEARNVYYIHNSLNSDIPKDAISLYGQRIIELPIYGEVRAGVGGYALHDYQGAGEWITKNGNFDDCYMLKVKGDSMIPRFLPGDFVIVRPQNDVDSGEVAIIIIDNEEGAIKRIKKVSDGIILKSDNSLYDDREFYGNESKRVMIIGKVIDIKAGRI